MIIKPLWPNLANRMKFIILGMLLLVSGIIFMLLGFLILNVGFGINILSNPDSLANLSDKNTVNALKALQLVQHIGIFIIPGVLFATLCYLSPWQYLQINSRPSTFVLIASILSMIFSIPLINFMVEINEILKLPEFLSGMEKWMKEAEAQATVFTEAFLKMDGKKDLVINMMVIAVIPAIGEELLFRGVIQKLLIDWSKNKHLGIWIAAILFSAIHLQFYGFLPRMVMGLLFGYLLVWTGSLWVPIICHLTNNGSAVLFIYLNQRGIISEELETIGTGNNDLTYLLVCTTIIAGLLIFIYRNQNKKEAIVP